MRLQLRVAELINAYVALASATVEVIDDVRAADAQLDRTRNAIDSRSAALVRAAVTMERFLIEHERATEARELAAEIAAVISPATPLVTPATTTAPVAV